MVPLDNSNPPTWETDLAANPCVNLGYHPGAEGCIRSTDSSNIGKYNLKTDSMKLDMYEIALTIDVSQIGSIQA